MICYEARRLHTDPDGHSREQRIGKVKGVFLFYIDPRSSIIYPDYYSDIASPHSKRRTFKLHVEKMVGYYLLTTLFSAAKLTYFSINLSEASSLFWLNPKTALALQLGSTSEYTATSVISAACENKAQF